MTTADLLIARTAGVARITLNRPARLNALGETTTLQLCEACREAIADPTVRVIVLTGAGEAFCAGGDFKDTFERWSGKTAAEWRERIRTGPNELVRLLQSAGKPVVASVNGVAVGGGATIALACDLRIASDRARFAFPFSRIGATPEFGSSFLLPRTVGLGRAMELLMLGEMIDAREAERLGLVNRVVPHEELAAATETLVSKLLERPAGALGAVKSMLYRGQSMDLAAALELEALALSAAFKTDEHRAAVRAFLERKRGDKARDAAG